VHPNYTTDQAILTQLYLDTMDERELQIISTTIELNVAAQAWSFQHGVILHNECYYILVTSPLLQYLLDSLGMTTPHLLAVGFHIAASAPTTQAFPLSILPTED
jgi:hypothetical protein